MARATSPVRFWRACDLVASLLSVEPVAPGGLGVTEPGIVLALTSLAVAALLVSLREFRGRASRQDKQSPRRRLVDFS